MTMCPTCRLSLALQGGFWYVHFASCFYIYIYFIMGCYYTLCHNTYAYSLSFYKVYMKRENAGSWNSGLEKEQILETYSAQLQKSWNSTKVIFGKKKYWAEEVRQRGPHLATRVGARPTPQGHEVEPWRNQSRAPAELFCRGNFPLGGGNHHRRHHQWSSHREGVNIHQHLHQHHLLSKP